MPTSALKNFVNVSYFVHPGAALVRLWVGEADRDSNVVSLAILSRNSLVCILNSFCIPFSKEFYPPCTNFSYHLSIFFLCSRILLREREPIFF